MDKIGFVLGLLASVLAPLPPEKPEKQVNWFIYVWLPATVVMSDNTWYSSTSPWYTCGAGFELVQVKSGQELCAPSASLVNPTWMGEK